MFRLKNRKKNSNKFLFQLNKLTNYTFVDEDVAVFYMYQACISLCSSSVIEIFSTLREVVSKI